MGTRLLVTSFQPLFHFPNRTNDFCAPGLPKGILFLISSPFLLGHASAGERVSSAPTLALMSWRP
jgi:hypothetical protein